MVAIFVLIESITCEANIPMKPFRLVAMYDFIKYPLEMFNRDSSRAFKQETYRGFSFLEISNA